ncbi:hypothetical protein HOF65_04480 [bacterium]|nr:hypothetical protein [bacterium]MBT3853218.1 hypothetical protein [bacterium]MBT4633371.1 hypothetical protein [bacterium]MBT6779481.1 hypothetical protein [bacterium]
MYSDQSYLIIPNSSISQFSFVFSSLGFISFKILIFLHLIEDIKNSIENSLSNFLNT